MSTVQITTKGDKIHTSTPYSKSFVEVARTFGGKWSAADKTWVFDGRDEQRVIELCRAEFGDAGQADLGETVTVHVDLGTANAVDGEGVGSDFVNQLRFLGRVIAVREARDAPVKLGRDVRLVTGRFSPSCGSVKNPRLEDDLFGIVLEVRDIPKTAFAARTNAELVGVTVIGQGVDATALAAERALLVARIAEIDALLGGASA